MGRCCILIITLLLAAFTSEGRAGPFKRPNKPDPAEHVPDLIKTLKNDPNERKRAEAAEELREYDLRTFPDIMPTLIEALANDGSASVRYDAVNSIGKLRPISQQGGYAIEQAAANDSSIRVRAAAKAHLVYWISVNGFRPGRVPENKLNQTEEPPLAQPETTPNKSSINPTVPTQVPSGNPALDKDAPRPAPPLMPAPSAKPSSSRSFFPLFRGSKTDAKPVSRVIEEGPVLIVPK